MPLRTHTYPDGSIEVYDSTHRLMRFAIREMNASFTPHLNSHSSVVQWLNHLLPVELRDMNYKPARRIMKNWASIFFSNRSRKGLIPNLAIENGEQTFQDGHWIRGRGDSRFYAALDGFYTSTVDMVQRMEDFMSWFPNPTDTIQIGENSSSVVELCKDWANAFMQRNEGENWYGHRLGRWNLYNFVHTGPLHDTPEDTDDPIQQFRFTYEGLPDSWWVMVQGYGAIAQAYTHLHLLTGDPSYADFAQEINHGLWMARINQATYLMPDTVTPRGPLPGDQGGAGDGFKYKHDTDCLYWGRKMFDAYGLWRKSDNPPVLNWPANLPPRSILRQLQREFQDKQCRFLGFLRGKEAELQCQIDWRRREVALLLNAGFPRQYLGMALGLTLDWIRHGWHPRWRQFLRKINLDGTPGDTRIYGDGKWNTLVMLIEAYRFTQDDFYLKIFEEAWGKFEDLSRAPELGGLFPEGVIEGRTMLDGCTHFGESNPPPDARYCYEVNQESFLQAILTAYEATVEAGGPRTGYLNSAESLANRIIQAYEDQTPAVTAPHNGLLGGLCIRLARARTTLRRIKLEFDLGSDALLINSNGTQGQPAEIDIRNANKAVVYMEEGAYSIQLRRNGQLSNLIPLQVGPADDPDDQPGRHIP